MLRAIPASLVRAGLVAACVGCGAAPLPREARSDVMDRLVAALPRGAASCVLTAPRWVSDQRRAVLEGASRESTLGWSRTPHVAASVRCRYEGAREGTVVRAWIDGEIALDALPMHVRAEGAPCEADTCDWPVARIDGEFVEIVSEGVEAGPERGAEAELARLLSQHPRALEIVVSDAEVRVLALDGEALREIVRDDAGRFDRTLSWDEIEVRAEDQRIRREHALRGEPTRTVVPLESIDFLDDAHLRAQLSARLERAARRRRAAVDAELEAVARAALERRSEDLGVVDLALEALRRTGHVDDALAWVERLARSEDHDEERAARVRSRGWAIAIRAEHPSAAARLIEAGLATPEDAETMSEALAGALAGLPDGRVAARAHVEPYELDRAVRHLRGVTAGATLTPITTDVALAPAGLVPTLLALMSETPFEPGLEVEVSARFSVSAVTSGVAVLEPSARFVVLPEIGVFAAGATLGAEIVVVADPFAAPGDGPFTLVVRIGPAGAPVSELAVAGEVRRGRVHLTAVSPAARGWDWERLGRDVVGPFATALERRFPDAQVEWEGEPRALRAMASDVRAFGYGECELEADVARCTVRPGQGLWMVLIAARSLGALPPE